MLLPRLLASSLLAAQIGAFAPVAAAPTFLPPEEAFRFEAHAIDGRTVEIVYTVAEGYYLYRERFAFAAEGAGVRLGTASIPPGKIQFDETFGKELETHRGRVVIRMPVEASPAAFTIKVTSQGCADAGLCYPPLQSTARVQWSGTGGAVGAPRPAHTRQQSTR